MQPWDLFLEVWSTPATKTGKDLDYAFELIDGQVALLLQGSTTLEDWINDFRCTRKVYQDQQHEMKMHKGLAEVWKSGNDEVMQKFIELCELHNCIRPLIAGHSMGGGLSLFAAEDFKFRTGRTADVVTFGAPRTCGDKKTADYIRTCCASVTQYAKRNDVVPMVPPFPFYHVDKHLIGDKFSIKQFIKFTDNHCTYNREEDYMTKVYKRILKLKKERGLTWDELAEIAGIKVSSWMTGIPTSSPTDEELHKIADAFGVTYEYLKYGK